MRARITVLRSGGLFAKQIYTTGNGHKFHVIHDMEGYYASVVSWFSSCGMTTASIHYAVNGKQDASSDAPAGESPSSGFAIRNMHGKFHILSEPGKGTRIELEIRLKERRIIESF